MAGIGRIAKILFSILSAVLICLSAALVTAWAAAPEANSAVVDVSAESTVSTWEELAAWLDAHAYEGGAARLTAPISVRSENVTLLRTLGAEPATLTLGEYGLTVSGSLVMYCPGLTLRGQGGENASARVLAGGSLALGYMHVEQGASGPLVWQDEGGILTLESMPADGAPRFAARPVAQPTAYTPLLCAVNPGEAAFEKLPYTMEAQVIFQGDARVEEVPVIWDVTDEQTAQALAERRRTLVRGKFAEIDTVGALGCTVAFLDKPVTFTGVSAKKSVEMRQIQADFTSPSLPITAEPEYSFDAEQWTTIERKEITLQNEQNILLHFFEQDAAREGELVWCGAENATLYLRVHWPEAERETDAYSDVLAIDGETMSVSSDVGGNRGGGTGIGPPTALPPPNGGEAPPEGDGALPTPPTRTNAGGQELGVEGEFPADAADARQPSPAGGAVRFGSDASCAGSGALQDKADNVTPPPQTQKGTAQAEPSESVKEMLAVAAAPEQTNSSAKAAGQIALGSFAMVGVIFVCMTWRHRSRRAAALLGKVFSRR